MKLVGFIGGCGGHLHNLGVVLLKAGLTEDESAVPSLSLTRNERIFSLAVTQRMHECGFLFSHPVSYCGFDLFIC